MKFKNAVVTKEILPPLFWERLRMIIPESFFPKVKESFCCQREYLSVRINTLKSNPQFIKELLHDSQIEFKEIPWYSSALLISCRDKIKLETKKIFEQGFLYQQDLASMIPPLILDPQPSECILDMCAAPGSKMSQMAQQMNTKGEIICLESVKDRFYKMKMISRRLGVKNAFFKLMDARKFKSEGKSFDKILVDAPCSCEGRFHIKDKKTYSFWSLKKIKEMSRKQKGLLRNACRLVKKDGMIIYSTCTFAPEENEAVVDWVLRKHPNRIKVLPLDFPFVKTFPALNQWGKQSFDHQIQNCLRILPDEGVEGFFIAKLLRVA